MPADPKALPSAEEVARDLLESIDDTRPWRVEGAAKIAAAIERDRAQVRAQALEEAAKVLDETTFKSTASAATKMTVALLTRSIRALAAQPPQEQLSGKEVEAAAKKAVERRERNPLTESDLDRLAHDLASAPPASPSPAAQPYLVSCRCGNSRINPSRTTPTPDGHGINQCQPPASPPPALSPEALREVGAALRDLLADAAFEGALAEIDRGMYSPNERGLKLVRARRALALIGGEG